MRICIIRFSGTGTTARIVCAVEEKWKSRPELHVCSLTAEEVLRDPASSLPEFDALVLAFPVYDYGPPEIIINAIEALPRASRRRPAALIATYGISSGRCIARTTEMLADRDYCVLASGRFKAPAPVATLYADANSFPFRRLYRFGHDVPGRVERFAAGLPDQLKAYSAAADDLLGSSPVGSIGRWRRLANRLAPGPAFSRATFGRTFYRHLEVSPECRGCGICVRDCPNGNLRLEEGKAAVTKSNDCLRCLRCVAGCPDRSINFTVRRRVGDVPKDGWRAMYRNAGMVESSG